MDVLMGPTFSIDVSAAQAADYSAHSPNNQRRVYLQHRVSAVVLEQGGEMEENAKAGTISLSSMDRKGLGMVRSGKSFEDSSDSSSSVGAPDDSEEEEEEGEESNSASSSSSSSIRKSLCSLDALEDSLPVKRGLSNYFTGKSKSFASLADASLAVSKAKDLEKPEHPFNKRRRILMANKWTRRSSFYSWTNPKSMPLLTLNEDDDDEAKEGEEVEEEEEEEEHGDGGRESMTSSSSSSSDKDEEEENEDRKRRGGTAVGQRKPLQERKFNNSFKCHSCFSLTDLQQQQRLHQNLQ